MSSSLRKFLVLDGRRRKFLLSAFFNLAHAHRALSRDSFKDLVAKLETNAGEPGRVPATAEQGGIARDIGWAVRAAASRTPWESSCLVQVLAAQRMLQARGIGGVFYIGAAIGESPAEPGFAAHAWLMCDGEFITGEAGHERYTVISEFSWV